VHGALRRRTVGGRTLLQLLVLGARRETRLSLRYRNEQVAVVGNDSYIRLFYTGGVEVLPVNCGLPIHHAAVTAKHVILLQFLVSSYLVPELAGTWTGTREEYSFSAVGLLKKPKHVLFSFHNKDRGPASAPAARSQAHCGPVGRFRFVLPDPDIAAINQ